MYGDLPNYRASALYDKLEPNLVADRIEWSRVVKQIPREGKKACHRVFHSREPFEKTLSMLATALSCSQSLHRAEGLNSRSLRNSRSCGLAQRSNGIAKPCLGLLTTVCGRTLLASSRWTCLSTLFFTLSDIGTFAAKSNTSRSR